MTLYFILFSFVTKLLQNATMRENIQNTFTCFYFEGSPKILWSCSLPWLSSPSVQSCCTNKHLNRLFRDESHSILFVRGAHTGSSKKTGWLHSPLWFHFITLFDLLDPGINLDLDSLDHNSQYWLNSFNVTNYTFHLYTIYGSFDEIVTLQRLHVTVGVMPIKPDVNFCLQTLRLFNQDTNKKKHSKKTYLQN